MIRWQNNRLATPSLVGFLTLFGMTCRFMLQAVVSGGNAAADNCHALYSGLSFRMKRSEMRNLISLLTQH